jgi:predicted transcriptional regulator
MILVNAIFVQISVQKSYISKINKVSHIDEEKIMAKLIKKMTGNFTLVSNEIFSDPRLSYRDVGIYCNMLSFPGDWDFTIVNLAKIHSDKKDAVSSSVSRLMEIGYVSRSKSQIRNKSGRFALYEYTIYQCPTDNPAFIPWSEKEEKKLKKKDTKIYKKNRKKSKKPLNKGVSPKTDLPASVKPTSDKPTSGNPQSINTISTKTFSTNTEEEDNIPHACVKVDLKAAKHKVIGYYIRHALDKSYPGAKDDINAATASMLKAMEHISDDAVIDNINNASSEDMEELLSQIYNLIFSKVFEGKPVVRVFNKEKYIETMISNWFSYSQGKNMWERIVMFNE